MGIFKSSLTRRGGYSPHFYLIALSILLMLSSSLLGQPNVNGRFYGDGDYPTYYTEYQSALNGRGTIYTYQDGVDLYIAVVVDAASTNDNVFAGTSANDVAYTQSVGWPGEHTGKDLILSDHLEITFTTNCGGTATSYSWWQDLIYAKDSNGKPTNSNGINDPYDPEYTWHSDIYGHDGNIVTLVPTGLVSSSSTAWNFNIPQTTWDMTEGGTRLDHELWKSPFTDPASLAAPNNLGYPEYDPVSGWEWPLVYEMHVTLDNATCSFNIELLAHNSPPKSGDNDVPIPEYDYGDLPDPTFPTLIENNGARHLLVAGGPFLGATVDSEPRGLPSTNADGDDNDGTDDEDGVILPATVGSGDIISVPIVVNGDGILNAWIDWNGNGTFDTNEAISVGATTDISLTSGSHTIDIQVPDDAAAGTIYARFRFSTAGGLEPTGPASDGEVEDYKIDISRTDRGDAPIDAGFNYDTADHTISTTTVRMGDKVDGDPSYVGDVNALTDDQADGTDDEDGIRFYKSNGAGGWSLIAGDKFKKGDTYKVEVDVTLDPGVTAKLAAWFNFFPTSAGHTFDSDAGNNIIPNVTLTNSSGVTATQTYSTTFTVPAGADEATTYMRFRLDTQSGDLGPTGSGGGSGEVEDYVTSLGGEEPVSVDLATFSATPVSEGIKVEWTVMSEINHAGYNLYRSDSQDGNYVRLNATLIGFDPMSSVLEEKHYEFIDANAAATSFYKLEDISLDGQSEWHGPIQATVTSGVESPIEVPTEFDLAQNYPNPFNPTTTISYALPVRSNMTLNVYDVQGRLVSTLINGVQAAGSHHVTWNGLNNAGELVPSGLYMYRMTAGDFTKTGRMTLLK
jgi:hypothetical protein